MTRHVEKRTSGKSDARISGMVAAITLVLIFAFTAIFIWLSA